MKRFVGLVLLLFVGMTVSCDKDPEIKKFSFYVGVKVYDAITEQLELSAVQVTVTSGRILFDEEQSAAVNKVKVEDGNLEYTLTLSKPNYITYSQVFSLDELKGYTEDAPLIVNLLDESLTEGLVACYALNGSARDGSGNYNDGTVYGATLTAGPTNMSNDAYQFNGASHYISFPPQALRNNNYSYSIWFKVSALPASGTAVCVLSIGDVYDSKHQVLAIAKDYSSSNTTAMSVGGYNNGSPAASSVFTGLPIVGQWYHIVGVRTNATLSMYVNGQFVGSADAGGTTPYYGSTVAAYLGARCNLTQYFNGQIANFLMYNRAITEKEIQVLYTEGIPCQ